MKFELKGIITPLATPMDEQGRVQEGSVRKLVKYVINSGIHGLFPASSQGEVYALSREQRRELLTVAKDEARGRVPVIAGTGANTTKDAVELTQMAEDLGMDACMVITPAFVTPSQDELYLHYRAVAESTSLPIFLYANPPRTGVKILPGLLARLAEIKNVTGIKESSGDLELLSEMIAVTRGQDGFSVLVGRDTMVLAALIYGAAGAVMATSNVAPGDSVEIYEAYLAGDIKRAVGAQRRIDPIRRAFDLGSFPVVIKEALNMIGIDMGEAVLPIGPMTDGNRAKLRRVLSDLGLLEAEG